MDKLAADERLTPHHVSLYITLFQYWNLNHFRNPISISREEIMYTSKIGSVNTYLKCMKELDAWSYIRYEPSFNPQRGSKVYLYRFDNADDKGQATAASSPDEQPVIPSINNSNNSNTENKEKGGPPTQELIIDFFLKANSTEKEAQKFFLHFSSNGWLVGGRAPMKDWQAAAKKWILGVSQLSSHWGGKEGVNKKNYAEPL